MENMLSRVKNKLKVMKEGAAAVKKEARKKEEAAKKEEAKMSKEITEGMVCKWWKDGG
jgi:hypothetical protein